MGLSVEIFYFFNGNMLTITNKCN